MLDVGFQQAGCRILTSPISDETYKLLYNTNTVSCVHYETKTLYTLQHNREDLC